MHAIDCAKCRWGHWLPIIAIAVEQSKVCYVRGTGILGEAPWIGSHQEGSPKKGSHKEEFPQGRVSTRKGSHQEGFLPGRVPIRKGAPYRKGGNLLHYIKIMSYWD